MCSANRPTCVFIVEPYPPRTFYASPLSDTSLMVTLGYGHDPSVGQCSQFILLTAPESSKTVKPCPSTTSVRLDGLISNTNYQVVVMVETVPTSSGQSVSSMKKTAKSWTCTFFKYEFVALSCGVSPKRLYVSYICTNRQGAVKTWYLTVKILSADFTAASKNSGKNLCCLLRIDISSVIDANKNEHTSRWYTVVFCFGDKIYDDMPLLN